MIDTERLGTLSAELALVQEQITERQERRHAIVRELVELLNESAEEGGGTPPEAERPATGEGAPPTTPSPVTFASGCPECGAEIKPQGLGTHRRLKHGVVPLPAAITPERRPCPDCGQEVRAIGLGAHRRLKHGRTTTPAVVPPAPETHRSESFLCSNNCGRSFPTRARRDQHETLSTCSPFQTRPPTAEGFRINGKAPAMSGDGFGQ